MSTQTASADRCLQHNHLRTYKNVSVFHRPTPRSHPRPQPAPPCGRSPPAISRAAVVGPQRTIDVVEACHPRVQSKILAVVAAQFLGKKLLPAVALLGFRRVSVILA